MDNDTTIIKHGIFFNSPPQFKCECGCVYETTSICVDILDRRGGPKGSKDAFCLANCPECHSRNSAHKYFTEEEANEER